MIYSQEKISDSLEEAKPLLLKHWQELESNWFPLDPDYEQYIKLEELGITRSFGARTEDGILIGYAVFFVRYHIHYKTILVASCDILFFEKEHRGQGLEFIQWCDAQLRRLGVEVVLHHVKVSHDFSPALMRIGYEPDEIKLTKRL